MISPLTAEDIPAEAIALKAELTEMLPFAPIVSLLIELDKRTGYLDCFTHAGGKQARSPELKRNLIAVLLAQATNLGLTRMAEACGHLLRHPGLDRGMVCAGGDAAGGEPGDHRLPPAAAADPGVRRRHPVLLGRAAVPDPRQVDHRPGDEHGISPTKGLSTYTHVTDQHATYGTKIIVATHREAHYVLDEILGNATDLPITEHATDTHGVTLVNFGLFDLLGMQLSPRIRDLGKITLYRPGPRAEVERGSRTPGRC